MQLAPVHQLIYSAGELFSARGSELVITRGPNTMMQSSLGKLWLARLEPDKMFQAAGTQIQAWETTTIKTLPCTQNATYCAVNHEYFAVGTEFDEEAYILIYSHDLRLLNQFSIHGDDVTSLCFVGSQILSAALDGYLILSDPTKEEDDCILAIVNTGVALAGAGTFNLGQETLYWCRDDMEGFRYYRLVDSNGDLEFQEIAHHSAKSLSLPGIQTDYIIDVIGHDVFLGNNEGQVCIVDPNFQFQGMVRSGAQDTVRSIAKVSDDSYYIGTDNCQVLPAQRS